MRLRAAAAAAACYVAVALWALRVVLPAPASTLAYSAVVAAEPVTAMISHSDQMFVAWGVSRNARTMVRHPTRLFDGEQCHPAARAVTLGESMFGDGLLGVVPYVLTQSPIVTMNAVTLLALVLPALTMYALVAHFTQSAGAAFVAGLLFGFHPARVMDPGHPFVYGNHWTPLALLFAHRLFAFERWSDAGGLVASIGLQLLESFYQIVALGILGGVVGLWLVVRHRHRLAALAPKLLAVAAGVAACTAAITIPYLQSRRAWGILGGRFSLLHLPSQFAPGSFAYPGSVVLGLAAVALVDRWRRRREDDARLVYLAAGLLVFWFVLIWIDVPGLGVRIPPLALMVARVVPGLDAVRALQYAGLGVYLVAAVRAGWGALVLLEGRGARARAALTAVLALAAILEVFAPPLARRSFGASTELAAWEVRPDAGLVALLEDLPAGAVLDLPFELNLAGELRDMAHYVFLGAYHHRPLAACYNSYKLPLVKDMETLARRLPDPRAVDALAALGFGTVVLHEELEPERVAPARRALDALVREGSAERVAAAGGHAVYRLTSPHPVAAKGAVLVPGAPAEGHVRAPWGLLEFTFRNPGAATYRHPDPIVPTRILVRWYDTGGARAAEQRARLLLPLALAPGEEATRTLTTPVPTGPGRYEVTLAGEAAPDRVLSRQRVDVGPS